MVRRGATNLTIIRECGLERMGKKGVMGAAATMASAYPIQNLKCFCMENLHNRVRNGWNTPSHLTELKYAAVEMRVPL